MNRFVRLSFRSFSSKGRRLALSWTCFLGGLCASQAWANMAALRPAVAGGPAALAPTRLEVARENLRIDCSEVTGSPRCTFEARYFVHNPTSAPEKVVAAFYGGAVTDVLSKGPGVAARAPLTAHEQNALDRAAGLLREGTGPGAPLGRGFNVANDLTRSPFTLTVGAGATMECVVTGTFELTDRLRGHYGVVPGRYARHLALSTATETREFELAYLLSPLRSWASAGPIALEVRYPSRWQVRARVSAELPVWRAASADAGLHTSEEGGLTVARVTLRVAEAASLTLRANVPASTFGFGGPLVGVGAAMRDPVSFRARFGYEVSSPGWLLHSLNLDTDFRSLLVLAPTVEVVSPQLLIIPWVSLGVGLPVRVNPSTDVGVRLQFGLGFLPVGFVISIDYFPGLPDGHADRLRTTLYAQVSF